MENYRGPFVEKSEGTIDCEVNHPTRGWIPFTASSSDPELHGVALYNLILNNHSGEIEYL